jgi:hypothetical protein
LPFSLCRRQTFVDQLVFAILRPPPCRELVPRRFSADGARIASPAWNAFKRGDDFEQKGLGQWRQTDARRRGILVSVQKDGVVVFHCCDDVFEEINQLADFVVALRHRTQPRLHLT